MLSEYPIHAALPATDLQRAKRYFADQLGLTPESEGPDGLFYRCCVRPRSSARPSCNNPGLILCHNHPSGDLTPPPEDIKATKQLLAAGRILDIELVDHIIIGHQRFVSLKEHLRWK